MYESCIKRLLDLILSLAACVVLAIPMGIIALWIKKDSPGPVFFKQRRVGRGKKCFNILKFRTMRGDTPHDVPTHLLKNADGYITKSGAFLRRTSLDELPQIYNIVAGQMSIIGPRPALYNQYDLIAARDAVSSALWAVRPCARSSSWPVWGTTSPTAGAWVTPLPGSMSAPSPPPLREGSPPRSITCPKTAYPRPTAPSI